MTLVSEKLGNVDHFNWLPILSFYFCVVWSSYSRHKVIVIKAFFSVTRKQDIYAESPHVQSKARFNISQSRKHTAVKTMTVVVNIQFCAIKAVCTLSENKSPTPLIFYNTEPTYKSWQMCSTWCIFNKYYIWRIILVTGILNQCMFFNFYQSILTI